MSMPAAATAPTTTTATITTAPFPAPSTPSVRDVLAPLRHRLRCNADQLDAWRYFHDHVVPSPSFQQGGRRKSNSLLVDAVAGLSSQVLGIPHEPEGALLWYVEEGRFWHGFCEVGPTIAIVLYFEDADLGLCGFLRDFFAPDVHLSSLAAPPVRAAA